MGWIENQTIHQQEQNQDTFRNYETQLFISSTTYKDMVTVSPFP